MARTHVTMSQPYLISRTTRTQQAICHVHTFLDYQYLNMVNHMKILQSNIFELASGPTHHMHNDSDTSPSRKLGIDLQCREIETKVSIIYTPRLQYPEIKPHKN